MTDTMIATKTVTTPRKTVSRVNKAKRNVTVAKPAKWNRTQVYQGRAYYVVGGTLLALSLDHLSTGIATVMHVPTWEATIMAIAVDVGFVLTECMPFTCGDATLRDTKWSRLAFVIAMFMASGLFNTLAIGREHVGWQAALAGFAIPAVIAACLHFGNRCILGRAR